MDNAIAFFSLKLPASINKYRERDRVDGKETNGEREECGPINMRLYSLGENWRKEMCVNVLERWQISICPDLHTSEVVFQLLSKFLSLSFTSCHRLYLLNWNRFSFDRHVTFLSLAPSFLT